MLYKTKRKNGNNLHEASDCFIQEINSNEYITQGHTYDTKAKKVNCPFCMLAIKPHVAGTLFSR